MHGGNGLMKKLIKNLVQKDISVLNFLSLIT